FLIRQDDLHRLSEFDFGCLARMKPGVTLDQARSDLEAIDADIAASNREPGQLHPFIVPLLAQTASHSRDGLVVMMSAVGVVLLIVCVNLSNLLLARSIGRQREFSVRAALGASRGRLARQLLVEALVLTSAGGIVGLSLAVWAVRAVLTSAPVGLAPL